MTSSSTKPPDHSLASLSDDERALLFKLFEACPSGAAGVNALRFRVKHPRDKKLIQKLVDDGLIHLESEHYFPSLSAIVALGTSETLGLLANAEDLYAELREAFEADHEKPVVVSELIVTTGLSDSAARLALSYMFRCTYWIQSTPIDVVTQKDAVIGMSEGVQDYETFSVMVAKLEAQRVEHLRRRDTNDWASPFSPSPASSEPPPMNASQSVPAWVPVLPSTISQVMTEVYVAVGAGLRTLAAIGVRTALDLYFSDVLRGDVGTFADKVRRLEANGDLTAFDASNVLIVIDGGNASAHRGYTPDAADLQTILGIGERLLRAHYELPNATKRLQANVPVRAPKPAKKLRSP